MKRKMNRTTLLLATLIAFTSLSYGQQMKRSGRGEQAPQKMIQELKLTDEQADKMKDLRMDHESDMIDLQASLKKQKLEMRKLMSADQPNKKKIYAQIEKINDVDVKIQKEKVDHRLAVRSILTEEQLKIYKKGMMMKGRRGGPESPGKDGGRGNRHNGRF